MIGLIFKATTRRTTNQAPLSRQGHPATWDKICDLVIERYFKHPSYWLVDGKPYFSIYEMSQFLDSFGSIENSRAALDKFRAKVRPPVSPVYMSMQSSGASRICPAPKRRPAGPNSAATSRSTALPATLGCITAP